MICLPPALARFNRGLDLRINEVQLPADARRRAACKSDLNLFAETYFSEIYWDPNQFHIEFGRELQRLILATTVQQQAMAAPRGIGKTTQVLIALIWAAVYKWRKFVALFALKAKLSEDRLDTVKDAIHHNQRLFEDFPEICGPVRNTGGDPRRAPPEYPWSDNEIRLPNGVFFVACGIDGSFLGLNKNALRPDFCLIDDPENTDTVRSVEVTATIEKRIKDEICSLETLGEKTAYLLLTTIRRRGCIGDRFTDPKFEPEWRGRRYKALITLPKRTELWDAFKELCRKPDAPADYDSDAVAAAVGIPAKKFVELTAGYRAALAYYAVHKAEMDEGAVVLDSKRLPLHSCFHKIATRGESVFASEYQNEPLQEEKKNSKGLDVDYLLGRKVPGQARGRIPEWADLLTVNIDVGMYRLHWQCDAWNTRDETSMLIDEGIEDTGVDADGKLQLTDEKRAKQHMITASIRDALSRLRLKFSNGWAKDSGVMMNPIIGIDVGGQSENQAWMRTVLEFCAESGPEWKPMRGAPGGWLTSYAKRAEGRNYYLDYELGYYVCNSSEFKLALLRAYLQPEWNEAGAPFPGTRLLHGAVSIEYAKHMTAEIYVENFDPGKPSERAETAHWQKINQKNHWLDCAWNSRALMEIVREQRRVASKSIRPGWHVPGANEESPEYDGGIGRDDPLMQ